jgi:phage-related tail fiber protein
VDSDDAFIYAEVQAPVTLPNNAVVYRNGVLTALTTIPVDNAIYGVRVPKSGGGGGTGTVNSVNGVTPDSFGNVSLTASDIPGIPAPYTLPAATVSTLGGVKIGSGLAVAADGTLSASGSSYVLPIASDIVLGGVMIGSSSKLNIDPSTGALDLDASVISQINAALTSVVSGGGTSLVKGTAAGVVTLNGLVAGTNITVTDNGAGGLVIASTAGSSTITLNGDVTGVSDSSGLIPAVLANSGVTAGVYNRVTVDAKGRVTAGVAATTLAGLGITADYLPLAGGSMLGDITMTGGFTIKSVPTPVNGTDVPNKDYVDAALAAAANGTNWKGAVDAASTGNLTLSGTQTIDGVAVAAGKRVLVKDQTDPKTNGIYDVASGAWTRSSDSNTSASLYKGAVLVLAGTANGLTQWTNTNSAAPVIGTDNITYGQLKGAANQYVAGAGLSLSGLTFSIANTGVTAGTYSKVTVNQQGQVTAGAALASADVTGALGFTPYNGTTNPLGFISGTQPLILTGDVTANGQLGSSLATTLANSGVTAGTYTSVTVDAKGRVTAGGTISSAQILAALGFTPVNKAGDTMGGALNWAPVASVASAATTPIGAASSNSVSVTGTTTITAFDTAVSGAQRTVQFAGILTLTNSAVLRLPSGANITTAAGDVAGFTSLGSGNWRCDYYSKADGTPLVATGGQSPFSTTQIFNGSVAVPAAKFKNVIELGNIVASTPTAVDVSSGAVTLSTSNAGANWTFNFRWSNSTPLGTALAVGDSVTIAVITSQGASAFYPTAFQIDGAAVTPLWQGGAAPSAGNANGKDVYTFTIIKQAAGVYVVLAAQTQYK